MDYFFAVLMAVVAYTCISAGFVLQKKGIDWMGWKGERDKRFYKKLALWVTGFIIMNIYGVPSAVALKTLPSYIVAAFAGWGIVALVFLSHFLLKERLSGRDYLFSFFIVVGIILLNISRTNAASDLRCDTFSITAMVIFCILPVILFAAGFFKGLSDKMKTFSFASASGMSAALMVISLGLLVGRYQYKVGLYFQSPNLYIYIAFALLSFIALQFACKHGEMMVIGPVQYSANIIYPLLAALFIFSKSINALQYLAIVLIVYSVSNILNKR